MYFQLAINAHEKGDLVTAKKLYLLALEADKKNKFSILFNIGMIDLSQHDFLSGANYFDKAIQSNQSDMACFANAAICHEKIGNYLRATQLFRRACELDPENIQLQHHLVDALYKLGDFESAIHEIDKYLFAYPKSIDLLVNAGVILSELGRHMDALGYFKKALDIDPNHLTALAHCAMSLMELTEYQESLGYSDKAIALNHSFAMGYLAKAITLHKLQRFKQAFDNYQLALRYDDSLQVAQMNAASILISEAKNVSDFPVALLEAEKSLQSAINLRYVHQRDLKVVDAIPFFRLKHDVQQAKFLQLNGYSSKVQMNFIETISELLEQKRDYLGQEVINLRGDALRSFLDYSTQRFTYEMPAISRSLLNAELDWHAIERSYISSKPELIYIDDFLSQDALIAFQRYCLFSKVWHKEYKGSYLGAFANQGFISPLHLKLALDLRKAMPNIFRDYSLGQLWGFKYDSQLGKGINVHADFAKVNLNFWITPTDSNLDLNSGGLRVYTVPAPNSWTFHDYNKDSKHIYEFLDEKKSESVTIPYRGNRAVLFNSALFHETDAIHFKDGYENRRINMTYLFGSQLA